MTTLGSGTMASAMRAKGHTCEARPTAPNPYGVNRADGALFCAKCQKEGKARARLIPLNAAARQSAENAPWASTIPPQSFAQEVIHAPRTVFPAQKEEAA